MKLGSNFITAFLALLLIGCDARDAIVDPTIVPLHHPSSPLRNRFPEYVIPLKAVLQDPLHPRFYIRVTGEITVTTNDIPTLCKWTTMAVTVTTFAELAPVNIPDPQWVVSGYSEQQVFFEVQTSLEESHKVQGHNNGLRLNTRLIIRKDVVELEEAWLAYPRVVKEYDHD